MNEYSKLNIISEKLENPYLKNWPGLWIKLNNLSVILSVTNEKKTQGKKIQDGLY